jgi:Response regulators consisting of a CheY-like receiver domain and a winged-helix DNA-binding domain
MSTCKSRSTSTSCFRLSAACSPVVAIAALPDEAHEQFRFGSNTVNFDTWEAQHGETAVRLTNLEMKLLKYFVDHEGSVISRQELLERVWGMAHAPATRTVDTFIFNLRKSFEDDPSSPAHFLSVRGRGYRFLAKPE